MAKLSAPPAEDVPSEEECLACVERLRENPLYEGWPPDELRNLVCGGQLAWRDLPRYSVVHREGTWSLSLYIIVSGDVALTSSRQADQERVLVAGDTFGHAAVVLHPRETALRHLHTAVTRSRTWLLVLPQQTLRGSEALLLLFEQHTALRVQAQMLAERLSTFALFQNVDQKRMLQLGAVANFAELPAGFALTQEGEKSTRFCLLWQGSVAVTKRGPGGEGPEVTLAVIKADAEMPYFGENCILSAQIEAPAGASVSTREPSQMFIIYREAAAEVLKTLPEFGNILLERKAMLRKTNKRLVEGASVGRMPAR